MSMPELVHVSEGPQRFDVSTGGGRRRRFTAGEKAAIVAESHADGNSVCDVARRYGLPLYRQAQIFARQGVNLDRSTLADWVGRAALLLEPVHGRLLEQLRGSTKLFADETTAPVLDPGRGRTKTGQLWAYARDDRPWAGADPPAVAYVYAPDRKAERPMAQLAGFTGVLQVNGMRATLP